MASEGPKKELCEEVSSCSVCLGLCRDPVILPKCGHNFCLDCLTQSWGVSGGAQEAFCPQCRGKTPKRKLCPNQQLANAVETAKKSRPLEEGICEKHREPLRFFCREEEAPLCVVCSRSREHRDHQVVPLEEAAGGEKKTVKRVCQKHWEPLKLFCRDHEALLCVVCEQSQEHKYHEIIPAEEAAQEYKEQFCTCVDLLQKERNKILAYKTSFIKKSQDLLRQTKGEREKMVIKFRPLQEFLEDQEKGFLAQMEEVEKEVEKKRDQHLAKLSEELFSLESLIQEMEAKCEQPAEDLLQDTRSILQRYEEKKSFKKPVAFPLALKWRIWDFSDLNPFLEGLKNQFKDTLDLGLHLQKANVILDPDTAHPILILSEDQKSLRQGKINQDLPTNPERFDKLGAVLGRQGFTGGRHFWEVVVGSEGKWAVGVARKSARRKGEITFRPEGGFWYVGQWGGRYYSSKRELLSLTRSGELKRIRVCLSHVGGRVAFFDADTATLLYEFSGVSFSGETLLPFFWVNDKGHLKISS